MTEIQVQVYYGLQNVQSVIASQVNSLQLCDTWDQLYDCLLYLGFLCPAVYAYRVGGLFHVFILLSVPNIRLYILWFTCTLKILYKFIVDYI